MSLQSQISSLATRIGQECKSLWAAISEKVDSGDSRLTDARDWTASIVSQTEAEAGTSTTARKWTAERVKQAIEALGGGGGGISGVITTTTSKTLDANDSGAYIRANLTGNGSITVPAENSVNFPIGEHIRIEQTGNGRIQVSKEVGVTVNTPNGSYFSKRQYSILELYKVANDVWTLQNTQDLEVRGWEVSSGFEAGLQGDLGDANRVNVFELNGSYYMILGTVGFKWSTSNLQWESNAYIVNGLSGYRHCTFFRNGELYCISAVSYSNTGSYGHKWNASTEQWETNSINAGLGYNSYRFFEHFEMGGNEYLLESDSGMDWIGWIWDDTQSKWIKDYEIEAGLSDFGSNPAVNVFKIGLIYYMIVTEDNANQINGFMWDGTQWVSNSDIIYNISTYKDGPTDILVHQGVPHLFTFNKDSYDAYNCTVYTPLYK